MTLSRPSKIAFPQVTTPVTPPYPTMFTPAGPLLFQTNHSEAPVVFAETAVAVVCSDKEYVIDYVNHCFADELNSLFEATTGAVDQDAEDVVGEGPTPTGAMRIPSAGGNSVVNRFAPSVQRTRLHVCQMSAFRNVHSTVALVKCN